MTATKLPEFSLRRRQGARPGCQAREPDLALPGTPTPAGACADRHSLAERAAPPLWAARQLDALGLPLGKFTNAVIPDRAPAVVGVHV